MHSPERLCTQFNDNVNFGNFLGETPDYFKTRLALFVHTMKTKLELTRTTAMCASGATCLGQGVNLTTPKVSAGVRAEGGGG